MRNWLGESHRQETRRRLMAVEIHLANLEERYSDLENAYNTANPAPPLAPEDGDSPANPDGSVARVAEGHYGGRLPTFPDED